MAQKSILSYLRNEMQKSDNDSMQTASVKFRENKTLMKFSVFTVILIDQNFYFHCDVLST